MNFESVFTEEGRTRAHNWTRRFTLYFLISVILALLITGFVAWWQITSLAPLQRIYLFQYLTSAVNNEISPNSIGRYQWLVRTIADPDKKGKDITLMLSDEQVFPQLNEDGSIVKNKQIGLMFYRRQEVEAKSFYWDHNIRIKHAEAYSRLRDFIYKETTIIDLFTVPGITLFGVFLATLTGAIVIDKRASLRYLKGKRLRGTQELTPKQFLKEHKANNGIGFFVREMPIQKTK